MTYYAIFCILQAMLLYTANLCCVISYLWCRRSATGIALTLFAVNTRWRTLMCMDSGWGLISWQYCYYQIISVIGRWCRSDCCFVHDWIAEWVHSEEWMCWWLGCWSLQGLVVQSSKVWCINKIVKPLASKAKVGEMGKVHSIADGLEKV